MGNSKTAFLGPPFLGHSASLVQFSSVQFSLVLLFQLHTTMANFMGRALAFHSSGQNELADLSQSKLLASEAKAGGRAKPAGRRNFVRALLFLSFLSSDWLALLLRHHKKD